MSLENQSSGNKSYHILILNSFAGLSLSFIVPTLLTSFPEIISNTKISKMIKFGYISRLLKQYPAGINNIIKILLF